jgi:hypothetical protein
VHITDEGCKVRFSLNQGCTIPFAKPRAIFVYALPWAAGIPPHEIPHEERDWPLPDLNDEVH